MQDVKVMASRQMSWPIIWKLGDEVLLLQVADEIRNYAEIEASCITRCDSASLILEDFQEWVFWISTVLTTQKQVGCQHV